MSEPIGFLEEAPKTRSLMRLVCLILTIESSGIVVVGLLAFLYVLFSGAKDPGAMSLVGIGFGQGVLTQLLKLGQKKYEVEGEIAENGGKPTP